MNKDYLKKFLAFKVSDFEEFHKKAYPHAHNRTHKSFRESLKRVEKIYGMPLEKLNLCFLNDAKETFDKFRETDYSHQTNISTFCMILKILKLLGVPVDEYNKFQNILNIETKKNQLNREEDLKDKLDYLPPYDIMKNHLRDKIENINETVSFQDVKYLLIVSMMVLSVPLKLLQYTKMIIKFIDADSNYIKNFLLEDLNGDYFVKSGDISVKINDTHLIKLIKLWINEFNTTKHFFIQHENSKTGMNNKELRIALNNATMQYFGETLTNSDLRSLYMKNLIDLDPSFKEKLQLSELLGYKNTNVLDCHKV
jgi:hypothetical protein